MNVNLLKGIVDSKKLAVLLKLLEKPEKIFSLTELSKETKVPVVTIMRIMEIFTKNSWAEQIKVGKIKLYRCAKNKKVSKLKELLKNE